jgi:hypothetical protein
MGAIDFVLQPTNPQFLLTQELLPLQLIISFMGAIDFVLQPTNNFLLSP